MLGTYLDVVGICYEVSAGHHKYLFALLVNHVVVRGFPRDSPAFLNVGIVNLAVVIVVDGLIYQLRRAVHHG